jgi:hypothetical protein
VFTEGLLAGQRIAQAQRLLALMGKGGGQIRDPRIFLPQETLIAIFNSF